MASMVSVTLQPTLQYIPILSGVTPTTAAKLWFAAYASNSLNNDMSSSQTSIAIIDPNAAALLWDNDASSETPQIIDLHPPSSNYPVIDPQDAAASWGDSYMDSLQAADNCEHHLSPPSDKFLSSHSTTPVVDPQTATDMWGLDLPNSQEDNHLFICLAGSTPLPLTSQFTSPMLVDLHAAALLWEDDYQLQDEDHSNVDSPSACHQDAQILPDPQADHIPQTLHSIPHLKMITPLWIPLMPHVHGLTWKMTSQIPTCM